MPGITDVAEAFFAACETGRGWEVCGAKAEGEWEGAGLNFRGSAPFFLRSSLCPICYRETLGTHCTQIHQCEVLAAQLQPGRPPRSQKRRDGPCSGESHPPTAAIPSARGNRSDDHPCLDLAPLRNNWGNP